MFQQITIDQAIDDMNSWGSRTPRGMQEFLDKFKEGDGDEIFRSMANMRCSYVIKRKDGTEKARYDRS